MESRPNSFYARDRSAWRKWLSKNHSKETFVWLVIYHQKSEKPSVYYDAAVEEALCFGWIDSKGNKRDDESYYLYFAKRKPASKWSQLNKDRVKRLLKDGLMHPSGLKMVELAKKTKTWTALEESDKLTIPPELKKMFKLNKVAASNFEKFPPSSKRAILEWISNAKRPETKAKRIQETVSKAGKNQRANQWVKKG